MLEAFKIQVVIKVKCTRSVAKTVQFKKKLLQLSNFKLVHFP